MYRHPNPFLLLSEVSYIKPAVFVLSVLMVSACSQDSSNSELKPDEQSQAKAEEQDDKELIVYSSRKEHLIKPIFDLYTKTTGTQIKYITDSAGPLIARLKVEGENTPADVFMTVDAGNLWYAAEVGLLKAVESPALEINIPARLRDVSNRWFGLSERARTIVYSTERVRLDELSTYEALAEPQFKGRLCLRTSKKVYNQSLVATLLKRHGAEKTEAIVKGWVDNLATDVFSNDTKAIEAILAGQCDVTIVNTYYFARLIEQDPTLAVKIFWPNQDTSGVHVNVSGAGVVHYSKRPKQALAFLEWLSSQQAQESFAQLNHEYPVLATMKPTELVQSWGDFKRDAVNISIAGLLQTKAVKLMDRAGYR